MKNFYKKSRHDNDVRDQCAHAWVHEQEDYPDGACLGGRMYYHGNTIYSYGSHFPIARMYPDLNVVLWNDATYSPQTSQHQSAVRGAIRHMNVIKVKVVDIPEGINKCSRETAKVDWEDKHSLNLRYMAHSLVNTAGYLKRARCENMRNLHRRDMREAIGNYKRYIQVFELEKAPKRFKLLHQFLNFHFEDMEILGSEVHSSDEAQEKHRKRQQTKARKRARKKALIARDEWIEGGHVNPWSFRSELADLCPTYLRIIKDDVQTSGGSSVPLKQALIMYKRMLAGKEIVGHKIGHFKIDKLNVDERMLTIGCHNIPLAEVHRILRDLI